MNTNTATNPAPKKKLIDYVNQRIYELNLEATARKNDRRAKIEAYIKARLDAGQPLPTRYEIAAQFNVCAETAARDVQALGYSRYAMYEQQRESIGAWVRARFHEQGRMPTYAEIGAQFGLKYDAVSHYLHKLKLSRPVLVAERRARIKAYVLNYQAQHGKPPTVHDTAVSLNIALNYVVADFKLLRLRDAFKLPITLELPHASPFGTTRAYLEWRLPRVLVGDTFVFRGVKFMRVSEFRFSISYLLRSVTVIANNLTQLLSRLFICLERRLVRSICPTIESTVRHRRRYMSKLYQAGVSKRRIAALYGITPQTLNNHLSRVGISMETGV